MPPKDFWSDPNPWLLGIVGAAIAGILAGIVLHFLFRKRRRDRSRRVSAKDRAVAIDEVEASSQVRIITGDARAVQITAGAGGVLNVYLDGLPDTTGKEKELFDKGQAHERNFQWGEAIETYRKCLGLEPEPSERIALHILIGNSFEVQGQLEEALGNYHEAMDLAKQFSNRAGLAGALNNIGAVYREQGELKKAVDYHQRALEINQEIAPRSSETATCLDNIGRVHHEQGEPKKALDYYQRALEIDQEIAPRSSGTATNLNNIGGVYHEQGEFKKALDYYQRALEILDAVGAQPLKRMVEQTIAVLREEITKRRPPSI